MQIKPEIQKLLVDNPYQLQRAEDTAISQIKNWLSARYDCNAIFQAPGEDTDTRDPFIVTITIDIALYHLYAQTGNRDIPEHRANRYQDALDWLREAGRGEITANLPLLPDEGNSGDIIISSRPPEDQRW